MRLLVALSLTALVVAPVTAQEPAAGDPATGDLAVDPEPQTGEPAPTASEPIESRPFDAEAATAVYLARLSPEEKARSDAYFEGGYWLQLWGFLYGLGIAWLLLAGRISTGMRDLAERVTRFRAVHVALYGAQYLLFATLAGFPLTVYQGFFCEHQYGLATQSFGPWLRDQAMGLGVGLVLFPVFLIVLYAVFRRAPRTWWLWGVGVLLVFLVFLLLIAPVYIAPLFNDYQALDDPAVVERAPTASRARTSTSSTPPGSPSGSAPTSPASSARCGSRSTTTSSNAAR